MLVCTCCFNNQWKPQEPHGWLVYVWAVVSTKHFFENLSNTITFNTNTNFIMCTLKISQLPTYLSDVQSTNKKVITFEYNQPRCDHIILIIFPQFPKKEQETSVLFLRLSLRGKLCFHRTINCSQGQKATMSTQYYKKYCEKEDTAKIYVGGIHSIVTIQLRRSCNSSTKTMLPTSTSYILFVRRTSPI